MSFLFRPRTPRDQKVPTSEGEVRPPDWALGSRGGGTEGQAGTRARYRGHLQGAPHEWIFTGNRSTFCWEAEKGRRLRGGAGLSDQSPTAEVITVGTTN